MIEDLVLAAVALAGVLAYATVGVTTSNVAERRLRPERKQVRWGWIWALMLESLALWSCALAYSMLTTTAMGEAGKHLPGSGMETPLVLGIGLPVVIFVWIFSFNACDYDDMTAHLMGIMWPLTLLTVAVNKSIQALCAGPVMWGNYLSEIPRRVEHRSANNRRKEEVSMAERQKELDNRARVIAEMEIEAGIEPLVDWKDG